MLKNPRKEPLRVPAAAESITLLFAVPARQWFTLKGAGAVLGLGESTVEKLYDQGALTGHTHGAGTGQRKTKRVLRASLIAYALWTADYDDHSVAALFLAALENLPNQNLSRVVDRASRLIADPDRAIISGPRPHTLGGVR